MDGQQLYDTSVEAAKVSATTADPTALRSHGESYGGQCYVLAEEEDAGKRALAFVRRRRIKRLAHQTDDLLCPRGARLDVGADEHVVVPGLEGFDQIVQRFFL